MKNNIKNALPAMALIAGIFLFSTILSLCLGIPVLDVMRDYNYSVLAIMIVMELFTNLIVETGIMQLLANKLAVLSKGHRKLCLVCFGLLMFFISALLNNITAVMMILPIIFVLLKTIEADRRYISIFFAVILALSNTGGASSPIGDFPAIVIMTSGITSFTGYLSKAFPMFFITSIMLLVVWCLSIRGKEQSATRRQLAIELLKSRYRNNRVNKGTLIPLAIIMICMFLAWSFVPQSVIPPEIIAVLGYCAGITVCSIKGIRIKQTIDMKSVLTIASFLFLASVVGETGVLVSLAGKLEQSISNPKMLLIIVMVLTSLISGLVSAGPAAAAMMPIIVNLCSTSFAAQTEWVAIAYAASICAGSSLFLWSATAGFILSGKIDAANLESGGKKVSWGISQYFRYGIINYCVQMSISIAWILLVV